MEELKKLLEKFPIDKIYEDLFQPGLKKAGQTLETVFDFGNTILLPFRLVNEKSRILLKKHLSTYDKKLNQIDEKDLMKVPDRVGLPIIEKLIYLHPSDLSEAFLNLLTMASSEKTIGKVHPSFITILNDLSTDEAKILFYIKDKISIPTIAFGIDKYQKKLTKPDSFDEKGVKTKLDELMKYDNKVEIRAAWYLTGLEEEIDLIFKKNIDIYIYNFERLKLIEHVEGQYFSTDETHYNKLEEEIYVTKRKKFESEILEVAKTDASIELNLNPKRGYFVFTDFGRAFMEACMKNIT